VPIDTGVYETFTRPDIGAGWLERKSIQCYTLKTVSGKVLPILKKVFLTRPGVALTENLSIRLEYHKQFILGLDILRAYDASLDLGRQTLRLAGEEVSQWSLGFRPGSGQ
jgi:hypothetical protein